MKKHLKYERLKILREIVFKGQALKLPTVVFWVLGQRMEKKKRNIENKS